MPFGSRSPRLAAQLAMGFALTSYTSTMIGKPKLKIRLAVEGEKAYGSISTLQLPDRGDVTLIATEN